MPLSFLTQNQQFIFVDPTTLLTVNAEAVLPGKLYDIYVVVENTDTAEHTDVQVNVWHSAFGIGLMAGTTGLTQPAPITVPPQAFGIPGTATASFTFVTPAGGHGCLGAQIAPSGASIGQNVTVINSPIGIPSQLSFVVFGGPSAENMMLTFTEKDQSGAVIPAGSPLSWKPLLIAPPGTGPIGPTPSPITVALDANVFYSVGLQVTILASATQSHTFQIVGTVNGVYEGEVDIVVNPVPATTYEKPDPYVIGGYQSPDILIFDSMGNLIPLGGSPSGSTLLQPDSDYKLSAVVHNDSSTDATNTVVRFWEIPFGTATDGYLLDIRTVTVPANGSVQVDSNFPFRSALPGFHSCAAVSVYNAQSQNATVDPTTAADMPWTQAGVPGPTAWRNTDSMLVFRGKPWRLSLAVSDENRTNRVAIEATAAKIPLDFEATGEAARFASIANQLGNINRYPLYLVTELQATLPKADLSIRVTNGTNGTYTIEGEIPKDALPGEKYLVTVNATYPDRTVQFFETLFVGKETLHKS